MRKEIKILGAIAIAVVIAAIIGANYYKTSEPGAGKTVNSNAGKTPAPRADANVLIKPDSAAQGQANAPVTIVEFFDPECESCRAMSPVVKKIMNDYAGKVRLVLRYMPLHSNSLLAAQVTEAAGEQGKFWQMHDLLFERQREWGEKREPQTALMEKYATEIGMNVEQMRAGIADKRYAPKIERDKADGQSVGVRATPTFFVNGKQLPGIDESMLRSLIDQELKKPG